MLDPLLRRPYRNQNRHGLAIISANRDKVEYRGLPRGTIRVSDPSASDVRVLSYRGVDG